MKLILQAIKSMLRRLERLVSHDAAQMQTKIDDLERRKIEAENPVMHGYFRLNPEEGAIIGENSTAEGFGCEASGNYSHAEGHYCRASGDYSHAEGASCEAHAAASHAEGFSTKANGDGQHVQGKNNVEDTSKKYAHIVGNGESEAKRSNAHTLDWDGNAWFAGTVEGTAVILSSPGGKRFKVTVDDTGTLITTEVTE